MLGQDDIFFELAEEGFRLLSDPARAGRADFTTLSPLDRIRAMFWRLYEFSRDYPQYFALMFVDRDVPRITREYERFAFVRDMKAQTDAVRASVAKATTRPRTLILYGVKPIYTSPPDSFITDLIGVVPAEDPADVPARERQRVGA